jgi:hypothetical protein
MERGYNQATLYYTLHIYVHCTLYSMYQYTLYNIDTVLLINGYSDENEHNKWDSTEAEFMNVQFR